MVNDQTMGNLCGVIYADMGSVEHPIVMPSVIALCLTSEIRVLNEA